MHLFCVLLSQKLPISALRCQDDQARFYLCLPGLFSWYSIGALISLRHAYKLIDALFVIFTRDSDYGFQNVFHDFQYVLNRSCNEKNYFGK